MRWPFVRRSTFERLRNTATTNLRNEVDASQRLDECLINTAKHINGCGLSVDREEFERLYRAKLFQIRTELMQLRRSSQVDIPAFKDDPQAFYVASDNDQASEVKFRQVKTVNVELRGIIGEAAKTLQRISNQQDVIEYARDLERFA